ncbi:TonB-linked outer membrane protein, SusC/RagA family [Parapedobacter luteus]|uniref:TonB-linked outer membrane protein, SusC/RagA family n=2 Tax=Parapedobacter luteus TaxID=623280 RepID=A0A1T5CZH7_9SPHI|nr:TonB-linked outer membrane protein, SusC/RagA family [Parapedobacter luteus]
MRKIPKLHTYIGLFMKSSVVTLCVIAATAGTLLAHRSDAQEAANTMIQFSSKRLSLIQVLETVQEQSGFNLIYSPTQIDGDRVVEIPAAETNLEALLHYLTANAPIVHEIKGQNVYINRRQQPGRVTGRVVDAEGRPLTGASVSLVGANAATMSGEDGSFALRIRPGTYTLRVSYIGYDAYEQRVAVAENEDTPVNAILRGTGQLAEVVVSYGTQRRREISGAVEEISAANLQDMPVGQFAQQLQGRIAGAQIYQTSGQPGRGMSWRIRNAASLSSGNSPLFVIDGMPITGSINNINPAEIESYTVLKDAAATALYGSRASNGVILITTKQARPGDATKIELNTNVGIQHIPSRGVPVMMNAREYATFMNERYQDMIRYEGYTGEIPEVYQNPERYGKGTDWFSLLTRTAPIQNYDLTFTSAGEHSTSSVVAGYQDQQGVVVNSGTRLYSLRINQNYRIADDRLQIGFNLAPSYRLDHNNRLADCIQGIVQKTSEASPLIDPYDENGNLVKHANSPGMVGYINPLARYTEVIDDYITTRILGNARLNYRIWDGLHVKGLFGVDKGAETRQFFSPALINGDDISTGTSSSVDNYSYTAEANLNYHKTWKSHDIDVLAGYSFQSFRQKNNSVTGRNFSSDDVPYLNVAANITGGSSNAAAYSLLSYLGRIDYSFKRRYLLSVSMRRDGSSRFGENQKYGSFPSVSAGWIISDEAFMDAWSGTLSMLKVRGSYGITGNNNIGNYTHVARLGGSDYVANGALAPGTTITALGNTNLAWERSKQLDVGLDVAFLNDKLFFTYDYYRKLSDGLIQNRPIPQGSGYSSITSNVGEIRFWGHEFSAGGRFDFGKLHWNTAFNVSFNRNHIVSLVSPGYFRRNNTTSSDYFRNQEGYPLGMFFGYVFEGLYQDADDLANSPKEANSDVGTIKMRDINGDNIIDENDRTFIGDPNPNMLFGLTNNFTYGRLDLGISMAGATGGDIILPAKWAYLTNMDGARNLLAEAADRWRSEENPGSGKFPRTKTGTTGIGRQVNSQWVEDGSYLSVKNITLGYRHPIKNAGPIKQVRLYTSVQNVFILTNYSGMNPEISLNGLDGTSIGIDENAYPVPRTFSFGLNLLFQ